MGPGGFGPPGMGREEMMAKLREPKPKSIKEVPRYLKNITKSFFSRLFYTVGLVWEARPSLVFLMVFMAIFNGVSPVVGAFIAAELITVISEALLGTATANAVFVALLWQFGFTFVNSLVNTVNNILTRISGEVVTNHIKVKIMKKAKEIDLASFDSPEFYERMENANREAGMRPVNIMNATFSMVSRIISMVSFIVVLVGILPKLNAWAPALMIVFVLLSILSAVVNFIFRRKNFLYMRHRSKDRRQMSYYSDVLVNKDLVKEVRLFDLSDLFIGKYNEVFKRYFSGIRKLISAEGIWQIGITLATSVLNCFLFYMIATGISEIGDYQLYTGALNSISGAVAALITTTATIYEGTLFIDNMILFMNEKKTIVSTLPEGAIPQHHIGHTVEFKDVSFAYPGTERKVLNHINLRLDPCDTVVLVGLNGAGKTTLLKLLTRLYDPTEGVILLDGRDIREYDPKELYKIFGIIFQDFGKYAFSVKENIAFSRYRDEINMDEIREAAAQSASSEFISRLPDGYDTPLMRFFERNGIELSIGQWQKLSVARAFYSDSDILILDEPTASLDPMAEQEIFNQFDRLKKDKTTIFVSHRLSSATTASKIVVLKNGEIIEMGDHQTLMAKGGEYYTLFSTQAKRYISSENEQVLIENFDNAHSSPFGKHPEGMPPPPFGKHPKGMPPPTHHTPNDPKNDSQTE
ncbi:MAG: ABC transporter ATP-binding protein [Clostridia bacterium]|nr:ABC transporter ATP-binding protein [Clostridia bacterium]